ncbi:hypothetical protein [Streptomyces sp. UNOC14_S4]|uniref:hypothetical protein n=1 Tax=Streptomyces sp. UNOC14_S4 TaxID=2872340 RepID=UPI000EF7DC0B|nr:hypothetical protein [Streptomyces sp. UNOC14_S4]MCC3766845.1 hypothetical protein [Streptomyces sp. UNOC14_S4]RLV01314.1 hypothetical protein CTZ27_12455 [Streptomyces griseocarneus]
MASTRTARVLAAVAALPMAALLFTGVASADDGNQLANRGSNVAAAAIVGSGVGHTNNGNSTTGQQQATGTGASNQNNTASVNNSHDTAIRQDNVVVHFVYVK